MRRLENAAALGVGVGVAVAVGNLFASTAEAAPTDQEALQQAQAGALTRVGGHKLTSSAPALPFNLAAANQGLDVILDAEGPDGCLARIIGEGLGITTDAGRAQYVTAGNIDLVGKTSGSNKQFTGEDGCAGDEPKTVANPQRQTLSFEIAAKQLPTGAARVTHKVKGEHALTQTVLNPANGNVLTKTRRHVPRLAIADMVNIDAGPGVIADAHSLAAQLEISDTTTICPDGSQLVVPGNGSGLTTALAQVGGEQFVIAGKHMSLARFQQIYNGDVSATEAAVKAAAGPPPAQQCPPVPPSPPPPVQQGIFTPGSVGFDMSWPNCNVTPPSNPPFGIVGVTGGTVYSVNTCLAQEAGYFGNLSLYMNTGWYSASSHVNPNSPRVCATDDQNCLAYNYGYNAALDAVNTVEETLGPAAVKTTWEEDLEPKGVNTWSDDVIQNRNSLQGEYDGLIASGALRVILYGTTQSWHDLTGDWQNGWQMAGATTETTAAAASNYCMGHDFTGGTMTLVQFQGETPSGDPIDEDYACDQ